MKEMVRMRNALHSIVRTLYGLVVAYWHHPAFSSGWHGDGHRMQPLWPLLYEFGVDVVVNGHDHDYERFAPQDSEGKADPQHGIREFVVGTGGAHLRGFETIRANSEARDAMTWGVLKLQAALFVTREARRVCRKPET